MSFDDLGARVRVRGKTGSRVIRLISSASLLARYLEEHPLKEEAQAPLSEEEGG